MGWVEAIVAISAAVSAGTSIASAARKPPKIPDVPPPNILSAQSQADNFANRRESMRGRASTKTSILPGAFDVLGDSSQAPDDTNILTGGN